MSGVLLQSGTAALLDAAVGGVSGGLVLRLFTGFTDVTKTQVTDDMQVHDFVEASGGGYAPAVLPTTGWITTQGRPSLTTRAAQKFLFTGPLTGGGPPSVRGYLVTLGGRAVGAGLLPAPFTPANAGDNYDVTPTLRLGPTA